MQFITETYCTESSVIVKQEFTSFLQMEMMNSTSKCYDMESIGKNLISTKSFEKDQEVKTLNVLYHEIFTNSYLQNVLFYFFLNNRT